MIYLYHLINPHQNLENVPVLQLGEIEVKQLIYLPSIPQLENLLREYWTFGLID